jgi:pyruvate,water dikinase
MPEPKPFPIPPDFPVTWPDPAMAALPWQQDRQHCPEPITPMSAWWAAEVFAKGFTQGIQVYDVPMATHCARINTYFYMAVAPNIPPEEMEAAGAKAEQKLIPATMTFSARWDNEWLPELQRAWADWAKRDLHGATDAALLGHLDHMAALYLRCWQIHFELLLPAMVSWSVFQDVYGELFGGDGLDAYRLLQGIDNKSMEAGRALWALSRAAVANPALARLIESTPSNELRTVLATDAVGRPFLARFEQFLAQFGMRSDTVQELGDPSWIEDPTVAFDSLKGYMRQDTDPDVQHHKQAAERERLVAEALTKLASQPPEVQGKFAALLAGAQNCSRLQEDHNYWIDQRSLHEVRQLCLEFGRRLVAAGRLARPDDALYIDVPELREAIAGADFRKVVAERRAEMDRWSKVTPAPMIGTDYGPPPDNPITKALGRFFGTPVEQTEKPAEIKGNAGSAGTVRGTARVIISIADAHRLQEGEILVTATTSPPWTPLFAIAGGIVTDTGGPLSHCAIVAREYGIPAVVGAAGATAFVKDGQTIEIDGRSGLVRLIS